MTDQSKNDPFVIAHLTDLHPDGGVAFAHAVALARDGGAQLVSFNAGDGAQSRPMPNAAALLASWEDETKSVPHTAVAHTCCSDPVDTILDGLRPMAPQLIVAGTHQWRGFSRAFNESVSEAVAVQGLAPTLVLPIGQPGFVGMKAGEVKLRRILVPVGDDEETATAVNQMTVLLTRLGIEDIDIHLLRVGDDEVPDHLLTPEGPGWRWHRHGRAGKPVDGIVATCRELNCDLVVMASRGQDGFMDLIRGTQTQQVMRKVEAGLLIIPV